MVYITMIVICVSIYYFYNPNENKSVLKKIENKNKELDNTIKKFDEYLSELKDEKITDSFMCISEKLQQCKFHLYEIEQNSNFN
jgi:hypothetical protein